MKDPKKLTEVTVDDIRRQQEELEDARRRWPEQLRGELLADGQDQEQTDRMVNFFTGAADDPGDSLVDWCDATLDADHWAGLDAVGPTDAAMLLCNLNPGDESVETAKLAASHFIDGNGDPGHIDGDDFKKLQRLFEVASQCDPRRRTLADWLGVAKDKGAKHHPWVERYLSAAAQQLPTPAAVLTPAPASEPGAPDYSMLSTRDRLITAFGAFTGMNAKWFTNLKDTPALLDARRVEGRGGLHIVEPWFCPLAVMLWLIDPKRKKGGPLSENKGWDMLQRHFPKVYNAHSERDPRED